MLSKGFLDQVTKQSQIDYTGNEWTGCMCGSTWILTPVSFDEDLTINSYGTVGFCCDCGAMISVPTPMEK